MNVMMLTMIYTFQAEIELHNIRDILADRVTSLQGSSATPSAVLSHLSSHSWVHFACHGSLNSSKPFESSFYLHKGSTLSLLQLTQARLPHAELALLAACHSAAGDSQILSLAAAMQFCGFRRVVGTLWEMADVDGPGLAKAFYKYMMRSVVDEGIEVQVGKARVEVDAGDAAVALHLAVKAMRDAGTPTVRWSTFIHLGI